MREAVIAAKSEAMTSRINAARARLLGDIFADWPARDLEDLVRLTRKYADALNPPPAAD